MGHPDRSDAELLAAHVAGDRFAFGELYDRHQRRLRRLARLTTGCPEDAEDALQEAMLSAHRGAGSFRHNAAVGSWLHRIVVNACLDRLRHSRIQPTEPLGEDPAVGDRTAEVETALEVHAALRRLPVEQRAAVVAVDMHGYSVADAAGALGVPQGTVKSRCARGRARLAVLLGRDHPGAAGSVAPGGRRITLASNGAMRSRVDDCA
ncbi:ECF RNA polymerase sigma factor SigM [Mycolicibacter terrae]|uniref:ECF RNA polymerase sigma factor SigM n=1 Tax=Mycolicibacter terrae TaxID=1788 RepID=A0AAD1HZM4_9MYCO|nr:RNA polymerase sigma factor SigM [Mycolicibacter terrae]ORW98415.1 RNA polymerase subunit sigma [Mycolicibacter terrae]BBX24638.1 ECF RNA polymerase sigma factor SigM [Mycolicibacter terrae]SNV96164.1 RNA polymerase sigma factor SigM [Mycolicibacter terrae]